MRTSLTQLATTAITSAIAVGPERLTLTAPTSAGISEIGQPTRPHRAPRDCQAPTHATRQAGARLHRRRT
ncbi:hypothetical protein [Embleya sp. NBC_00896]|uniref:hypothetical protein n=1 Tax=Embleya sp. NBC_00896 TaxID=2975961 RepID=UPI00386B4DC9|nr:hypothetical protein OG928_06670 [Embleya sp. NBC_00896]